MTALLIRHEQAIGRSRLREVSVEHVLKLLFAHEQASDLNIHSDRLRFGQMRIHPQIHKETGQRSLDFSGTLQFHFPSLPRQRVSWDGAMELDPMLAAQRLQLNVTMHEPNDSRAEVRIEFASRMAYVTLRNAGTVLDETYTLDDAGATKLMQQLGIDAVIVRALAPSPTTRPTISAQQSFLRIHGERIETYMVTIEQGGQTLLELHLSQLGQILHARTLIGYTLAPDDLMP